MKRNITLLSLLFSLTVLTSCVSTNKGFQSSPVLSRNVELDPIKADVKVYEDNKLKGKSTSSYFLLFRVSGDNTFADGITYSTDASTGFNPLIFLNPFYLVELFLEPGRSKKVRGAAAYKAMNSGDYDILVNPTYTTTIKNYLLFKKYIVTVEGYGATYENFRTEKQKKVILENGKEYTLDD